MPSIIHQSSRTPSEAPKAPAQEINAADLVRRLEDGREGRMIATPNVPGIIDLTNNDDVELIPVPTFLTVDPPIMVEEMNYFFAL